MRHPSTEIWLVGDLANVLRDLVATALPSMGRSGGGLVATTAVMPPGEYRNGYLAAMAAVALATGAVDAEPTDLAKTITRMMGGGGS